MVHTLKKIGHKLFGYYLIAWFTAVSLMSFASAQNPTSNPSTTTHWFGLNEGVSQGVEGIWGIGQDEGDGIITVIKQFINWALGLLALIALVMLLWWGYKMVASGGDEDAYKEGLKILKNAAIGIAFIATSWLLVSLIFYVIGLIGASS